MSPILSVRDLAWRVGIPASRLRKVADNVDAHYSQFPIRNGDKVRILRVPKPELMDIQRRIKKNVLEKIPLSSEVHGGIRGKSAASNAAQHLGKPCVVTVDVKGFFPNVRHYIVYRMFRNELGFGRDVASLLTRLTTLQSQLPQGAPTSTAVANLLLAVPVDAPATAAAEARDVAYTRFVDDIAMSGDEPRPLINLVARMLSRRRLRVHRAGSKSKPATKLRISTRSQAQEVTGLLVNSTVGPSISRARRDRVRAAIFALRVSQPDHARQKAVRSIAGRIAHVGRFNRGEAVRLKAYLAQVLLDTGETVPLDRCR